MDSLEISGALHLLKICCLLSSGRKEDLLGSYSFSHSFFAKADKKA